MIGVGVGDGVGMILVLGGVVGMEVVAGVEIPGVLEATRMGLVPELPPGTMMPGAIPPRPSAAGP